MKELLSSIKTIRAYEMLALEQLVKDFEFFSKQTIGENIVDEWRFTGLSNIDFLTSDFLNRYGLKNLLQFTEDGVRG